MPDLEMFSKLLDAKFDVQDAKLDKIEGNITETREMVQANRIDFRTAIKSIQANCKEHDGRTRDLEDWKSTMSGAQTQKQARWNQWAVIGTVMAGVVALAALIWTR